MLGGGIPRGSSCALEEGSVAAGKPQVPTGGSLPRARATHDSREHPQAWPPGQATGAQAHLLPSFRGQGWLAGALLEEPPLKPSGPQQNAKGPSPAGEREGLQCPSELRAGPKYVSDSRSAYPKRKGKFSHPRSHPPWHQAWHALVTSLGMGKAHRTHPGAEAPCVAGERLRPLDKGGLAAQAEGPAGPGEAAFLPGRSLQFLAAGAPGRAESHSRGAGKGEVLRDGPPGAQAQPG